MNIGICPLSVVPIRSNASDKSEMVSQLLFGEMVELLEKRGNWSKVRCLWDNYIGWLDTKQIKIIPASDVALYQKKYAYSMELVQPAVGDNFYLPITIGATLPDFDGLKFRLNGSSFTFSGQAISPQEIEPSAELLIKVARRYLYAPYLWGGRSPMGIDCSGFTQVVFKMLGTALPRDAAEQVGAGDLVDFAEESKVGDLAFFENRKAKITHVGIIMPEGKIIHASGQVRIDRFDHFGIYNEDKQKYTHRLRVIKRILPNLIQPKLIKVAPKNSENEEQVNMFN
ncbi:MAG: C40 family peptidase [Saprospiraceae bacterium]